MLVRSVLIAAIVALAGCANAPRYAEGGACAAMWLSASPYAIPLVIACALRDVQRELKAGEEEDD